MRWPASFMPSSSTRSSPMMMTLAFSRLAGDASSLTTSSGPMPVTSPSMSPIRGFIFFSNEVYRGPAAPDSASGALRRQGQHTGPGVSRPMLALECLDLREHLQRCTQYVETVEIHLAMTGLHLERVRATRRCRHDLFRHIDRQTIRLGVRHFLRDLVDLRGFEHDRQQPVVGGVVVEDLAIARRKDRCDARLLEAPYCMFAARTAAEVGSSHEDRS